MNNYGFGTGHNFLEEATVCSFLFRYPEKYVNALPYPVQEEDFTDETCRRVFCAVCRLYAKGEPFSGADVEQYIQENYPEPEKDVSIWMRIILSDKLKESNLRRAAKAVRQAGLIRRYEEKSWPDEQTRLAEYEEIYALGQELDALLRRFAEEEEERRRQLENIRRQEEFRKQAQKCPPESHPLTPVLITMAQATASGTHSGSFWSYADVRELSRQELGFDPVKDSRELLSLLPQRFLDWLAEEEGIVILLRQKHCNRRGLRIERIFRKRTKDEIALAYEFTPQLL